MKSVPQEEFDLAPPDSKGETFHTENNPSVDFDTPCDDEQNFSWGSWIVVLAAATCQASFAIVVFAAGFWLCQYDTYSPDIVAAEMKNSSHRCRQCRRRIRVVLGRLYLECD